MFTPISIKSLSLPPISSKSFFKTTLRWSGRVLSVGCRSACPELNLQTVISCRSTLATMNTHFLVQRPKASICNARIRMIRTFSCNIGRFVNKFLKSCSSPAWCSSQVHALRSLGESQWRKADAANAPLLAATGVSPRRVAKMLQLRHITNGELRSP